MGKMFPLPFVRDRKFPKARKTTTIVKALLQLEREAYNIYSTIVRLKQPVVAEPA